MGAFLKLQMLVLVLQFGALFSATVTPQVAAHQLDKLLPQHIGHNEEPNVAAADVDLLEMADTSVTGGDGDILELDVHVVLGCLVFWS